MIRSFFFLTICIGLFADLSAQHITAGPPAIQNGANDLLFFPIEQGLYDCNGDFIYISGTAMLVRHLPKDMSDGYNKMNYMLQDAEGVNMTTGERYRVLQHQSLIVWVHDYSNYTLVTGVMQLNLIGEKTGTSLRISQLSHFVFHQDGTWQLVIDQVSTKCGGEPTTVRRD